MAADPKCAAAVRDFLRETFGEDRKEEWNTNTELEADLGLDALGVIDLFKYLDDRFNITTEDDVVSSMNTLGDVSKYLESKNVFKKDISLSAFKSPWISSFGNKPKDNALIRLFCFFYAGGNVNMFRSWEEILPDSIEVVGVNLPGHQGSLMNQDVIKDVTTVARAVVPNLIPLLEGGKPFALFGHSFGSLVAFEVGLLLQQQKFNPAALIVSGRRCHYPSPPEEYTHVMSDRDFVHKLYERYQDPPLKMLMDNDDLMQRLIPSMKGDMTAFETYRYEWKQPPFKCPIAVFAGTSDSRCSDEQLQEWQQYTTGKFIPPQRIQGGHFFLQNNAKPLLEHIQRILLSIVS